MGSFVPRITDYGPTMQAALNSLLDQRHAKLSLVSDINTFAR
jgi:hypothetical protein